MRSTTGSLEVVFALVGLNYTVGLPGVAAVATAAGLPPAEPSAAAV